ncbi:MAG: hypothetical protein D6678_06410 [Zetaproteobacteria bacterium]|nr:MAG: hypothetical protein D6678_06410 [Zetaproteobacteria bacterium]
MMRIATGGSVQPDALAAASEAWQAMRDALKSESELVICAANAAYDAEALAERLHALAPDGCVVAGASSCSGSMNETGLCLDEEGGVSLIGFADDGKSAFGAGLRTLGDEPERDVAEALLEAMSEAGRLGEVPDLIWLSAAPGCEERLLAGIAQVVGASVPVVGGSSADNAIEGRWWQMHHARVMHDGVLVIVFYTRAPIAVSFHSGYAPTERSGLVTRAEGRKLHEIDGCPAARVYDQWTGGLIGDAQAGANILAQSTFHPLGLEAGRIADVPYYYLLHPESVLPDGGLSLFADAPEGARVVLMEGSADSLVRRAGSVATGMLERQGWTPADVAGALVVYCAGCMLGVRDRLPDVQAALRRALPGVPFQTQFTFGEQGCFIDGVNRHGNLMIAVVLFGRGCE